MTEAKVRTTGKHTPGPYRADDNGDGTHCITAGRGHDVADTRASGNEWANALLLVAAPDLLAALEFCRSVLIANKPVELSEKMAVEKAEDAINKATYSA